MVLPPHYASANNEKYSRGGASLFHISGKHDLKDTEPVEASCSVNSTYLRNILSTVAAALDVGNISSAMKLVQFPKQQQESLKVLHKVQ